MAVVFPFGRIAAHLSVEERCWPTVVVCSWWPEVELYLLLMQSEAPLRLCCGVKKGSLYPSAVERQ